jgi:cytochrome c peroxidase
MFQNKTKVFICAVCWITCLCIVLGLKTEPKTIGLANTVSIFREGAGEFSVASLELKQAIAALNVADTVTLRKARLALKNSRMRYKKIEFFMNYFFESESMIYNKPAKVEVEEPYMEYQEPSGFQVMEAMLFDSDPVSHQKDLAAQADLVSSSAADLNALLYGFEGTDKEILESVRLELLRVITLSITGYDAPELKTGIEESYVSVETVSKVLQPYLKGSGPLSLTLVNTLRYLKDHPDFDSFDRMVFLTQYALPMQEQLRDLIHLEKLDLNSKTALNYQAKNIFSKDAVLSDAFPGSKESNPVIVALGKKLFTEKALSGNLRRSCSDCHRPEAYFTDGLKTSLAFDGNSYVQRNAPSLLYAGFQYAQFWDGRAKSLQEQIKTVISNPLEMNGDHVVIVERLKKDTVYLREFQRAFPDSGLNTETLSDALAAYVKGLAPMNSAFDNYVAGDKKAMSAEQVRGFNLFMGKGQCGSCHFAPLFNGLIPPFYKRTEYEILGTPENDDFDHLKADKDKGRSGFFPISYYEAAFKTPTVRNAEKTSPYMHNGVFKDLDKVVEFYNQGGGAGLHLDLPQQTLSAKPLHLSKDEVRQIVVFMQSLTDKAE